MAKYKNTKYQCLEMGLCVFFCVYVCSICESTDNLKGEYWEKNTHYDCTTYS